MEDRSLAGHRRRRWDWRRFALLALCFAVIGCVSLISDLRGYASWPRKEARVVRVDSGFGWAVPEYRVACYSGVDEVSGAKRTLIDDASPTIGERTTVACQPASEGLHAYSGADHRALLHRDLVFILIGAVAGVVAWRLRRSSRD